MIKKIIRLCQSKGPEIGFGELNKKDDPSDGPGLDSAPERANTDDTALFTYRFTVFREKRRGRGT